MASHRLIQHVGKTYGLRVSEGLYDRLNTYYFVDGHALNDKPRLAQVAAAEIAKLVTLECKNTNGNAPAPMTEEEILTFLQGNQGRKEIEMALQALNDLGVHGIPKFVIEGRQVVDGAAHSSVFIDIFREIEARGEVAGKPVFASILGVDDETIQRGSHYSEEELAA